MIFQAIEFIALLANKRIFWSSPPPCTVLERSRIQEYDKSYKLLFVFSGRGGRVAEYRHRTRQEYHWLHFLTDFH